jgi:hypothetical protein
MHGFNLIQVPVQRQQKRRNRWAAPFLLSLDDGQFLLGVFGQVSCDSFCGRFHGLIAFLPVGRTDLVAMRLYELQGIDHAQGLVDAAP